MRLEQQISAELRELECDFFSARDIQYNDLVKFTVKDTTAEWLSKVLPITFTFKEEYEYEWWVKEDGFHQYDDHPAYQDSKGVKMWFDNNRVHRVNGPAIINRHDIQAEWFLHGHPLEFDEYVKESQRKNLITDEEIVILKLKWK